MLDIPGNYLIIDTQGWKKLWLCFYLIHNKYYLPILFYFFPSAFLLAGFCPLETTTTTKPTTIMMKIIIIIIIMSLIYSCLSFGQGKEVKAAAVSLFLALFLPVLFSLLNCLVQDHNATEIK